MTTAIRKSEMEVIRDRDGNVIRRSKNLRGIRHHISQNILFCHVNPGIRKVVIGEVGNNREGRLHILFNNGDSYESGLWAGGADHILQVVLRWKNLHGAPLRYMDQEFDRLDPKNKTLQTLANS